MITGAPCSGKTTLVDYLESSHGIIGKNRTVAREYIEEELAKGRDKFEIRDDQVLHQKRIFDRKMEHANSLDPLETVMHDYGIPDSIAFNNFVGIESTAELVLAFELIRYGHIFILDSVEFLDDSVRTESAEDQAAIDAHIEETYRSLGYQPIRVPAVTVEARAQQIIAALEQS